MIKTKDVEKITTLGFYSSYIKDEKPVNLMILSDRCESGKTQLVLKFFGNVGLAFLSDVTAYALWRDFKDDLAKGNLKHIIIPEFLAPLSRKSETVGSLIATLQMLIEEGVMEVHTGFLQPIKLKSPVVVGLVICMPRMAFEAKKIEWTLNGFLSRFLLVSYTYEDGTVGEIFDSIENRDYLGEEAHIKINAPPENIAVKIPAEIRHQAREMVVKQTEHLRKSGKGYGFRELKNMLRFLCANVVFENSQHKKQRDTVNQADFDEVVRLSYLMNDEFNPMRE